MTKKTYVTTTIPYVNAAPHVGHALEFVQADAIARYNRLLGRETRFQTGTDENASKNVESAKEKGIPVQEFIDRNSQAFRDLVSGLGISTDEFLRTSEARHRAGVHAFWKRLKPEDLYRQAYRGLYCAGCEDFYLERDLVAGCCPDHGIPPKIIDEGNVFFRLSRYQEQIEDLIGSDAIRVFPEKRKNEVLSFVREGLQDFSVSRPAERSGGWGIPVPDDSTQVVYVWIDALINYLSGLGFGAGGDWERFWNADTLKIHVIGKNVWKFHAVYWPALLLSAGLPLPDEIVVHGFLTADGRKIGKSLGNAIDPWSLIDAHGSDALRFYFLRAVSPFEDGDFSTERFKRVYNSDLANGLGNLARRITSLAEKAGLDVPCSESPPAPEGFHEAFRNYEFGKAIDALWRVVNETNLDIESVKPWALEGGEANDAIRRWVESLRQVAFWIAPILPDASGKVLDALRRTPVKSIPPLFPRI